MKRVHLAAALVSGLALAGALVAPAAVASVTNPADNPRKIVVIGSDGEEYTDGLDTLPGFDDYACTFIPGAYYDFANNRVHYADGQSIPWTEWERIAGYKTWLDKQKSKDSSKDEGGSTGGTKPAPKPTSKPKTTKAPAPKASEKPKGSTSTGSGTSGSTTKGSTTTSAGSGKTSTKTSTSPTTSSTATASETKKAPATTSSGSTTSTSKAAATTKGSTTTGSTGATGTAAAATTQGDEPVTSSEEPTATASDEPTAGSTPEAQPTAEVLGAVESAAAPTPLATPDTTDAQLAGEAEQGSSAAGVLILVGLVGAGLATYGGYEVYRRSTRKGSA